MDVGELGTGDCSLTALVSIFYGGCTDIRGGNVT